MLRYYGCSKRVEGGSEVPGHEHECLAEDVALARLQVDVVVLALPLFAENVQPHQLCLHQFLAVVRPPVLLRVFEGLIARTLDRSLEVVGRDLLRNLEVLLALQFDSSGLLVAVELPLLDSLLALGILGDHLAAQFSLGLGV